MEADPLYRLFLHAEGLFRIARPGAPGRVDPDTAAELRAPGRREEGVDFLFRDAPSGLQELALDRGEVAGVVAQFRHQVDTGIGRRKAALARPVGIAPHISKLPRLHRVVGQEGDAQVLEGGSHGTGLAEERLGRLLSPVAKDRIERVHGEIPSTMGRERGQSASGLRDPSRQDTPPLDEWSGPRLYASPILPPSRAPLMQPEAAPSADPDI